MHGMNGMGGTGTMQGFKRLRCGDALHDHSQFGGRAGILWAAGQN